MGGTQISITDKIEIYLNTLNHIFIGFVTVYITWFCFNQEDTSSRTLHIWLCTIGYQFLMAEAILSIYHANSWSYIHIKRTKTTIHWILQIVGSAVSLTGIILEYQLHRTHFRGIHELTGLISGILLLIGLINGVSSLWANELKVFKVFRKPSIIKFSHNFIGFSAFLIGMVSIYYGYELRYMARSIDRNLLKSFQVIAIVTIVLSAIGPIRSGISQLRGFCI